MQPIPARPIQALALLVPALFLGACGGGGGAADAGAQPTGSADLLVATTGHPDLFALEATLAELRLVGTDGTATANLLPSGAGLGLELVGLADTTAWLASAELPDGSYAALRVGFAPDLRAVTPGGVEVPLALAASELELALDDPLVVRGGSASQVRVELDLLESLPTLDPPVFTPAGDATTDVAAVSADLLYGVVRQADTTSGRFTVDAFADAELRRPLGLVAVVLADDALLVDEGGDVFASREAFLGSLRSGLTVLELEGVLEEGRRLTAGRVAIVDQAHGDGRPMPVRIEGTVAEVGDAGFGLMIRRILSGADVARPVLEDLGDPRVIDVGVGDGTRFAGPGRDGAASFDDLHPGQRVVVEFSAFVEPPFPAGVVLFRDPARCLPGTIAASHAPRSITLRLRNDDPARNDDAVGDGRDVEVLLEEARLTLILRDRPPLRPEELIVGMRAVACGRLGGTPDEPVLDARAVRVHPGFFVRGLVGGFDRAAGTFETTTSRVVQPFGSGVESGPLRVALRDGVRVRGAAKTVASFYDLLERLTDQQRAVVKVKGIGAPEPGRVQAFDLHVQVVAAGDGQG